MPGFGISDRFEKPSLEIEEYMSISTPGFQNPSFTAFPNKPTTQPPRNIAHVVYTELTPQIIKERKIYHGLIYTAWALMLSSWLSYPIHQGLQKFSPKLAQRVTQKGLEKNLGLSAFGLFAGILVAVLGFCKHPNQRFTLENVDISALKQTGTITKQSQMGLLQDNFKRNPLAKPS